MKKLVIIGIGTRRFEQMTLESLARLKSCDAIAVLETPLEVAKEFCQSYELVKPMDLNSFYRNGAHDLDNYHSVADHLLDLFDEKQNVALLVSGHPRLGVYLTDFLTKRSRKTQDFEIEVLEGISSFDVMTNIIERDPLEKGTSILDINRAILYKYDLNVQADHYFYHVCSVLNSATDFNDPSKRNRTDLLKSYLLEFFPADTEVFLIDAGVMKDMESRVLRLAISDLEAYQDQIRFSTTLFVPGLKPTQINRDALKVVRGF